LPPFHEDSAQASPEVQGAGPWESLKASYREDESALGAYSDDAVSCKKDSLLDPVQVAGVKKSRSSAR
jgi:hypothetical protein